MFISKMAEEMNMRTIYQGLIGLFLILTSLNATKAAEFSFLTSGNVVNTEIIDVRDYDLNMAKKSESIDASTAASKLRANKSHYVSKQDET